METITPIVSALDLSPEDTEQVKAFDIEHITTLMHNTLVDSDLSKHPNLTLSHAYIGPNKLEVWDFRSTVVGHYRDRKEGDVWLLLASGHTFNLDGLLRQLSNLQDQLTRPNPPL